MFRLIGNFLRTTFGFVGLVLIFMIMCVLGYVFYWGLEAFFIYFVENEWITNKYIVPIITWIFEGDYSEIIEIIMVVGFGVLASIAQADQRSDDA